MISYQHTIAARIAEHARRRPDVDAILFEDVRVSYAKLHAESNRVGHALLRAGLDRGSRVAYLGRESHHFYTIAIACAKIGAVLVPVNPRLTTAEINHVLRDSTAEILFVEHEFASLIEPLRADLAALRHMVDMDAPGDRYGRFLRWFADCPPHDLEIQVDTDDPVAQMYTSGTTGLPKGVILAHRTFFTFIDNMQRAGVDWIDWRPEDRSLSAFPGLHAGGYAWFMHSLNVGATSIVMQSFVAGEASALIERHAVTALWAAPAMLQIMLSEPDAEPHRFRSLRKIVYGGSPISPELQERCMREFDCDLVQAYAAAETGSFITCLRADEHTPGHPKLGSAGRICPGNDLRIVDEAGVELPPGQPGRICVRTPAEFIEYANRPDETAAMKVDGWLRMGDSGYLDDDGYLYLRDRINDTIVVAGQNIYPVEVENVIRTHPDVADVAVYGVPHPRWGEVVHAAVVLAPGAQVSPRQLMLFLRGRIADYKVPVGYRFVDSLPRNPTGKVLRRVLRAEDRGAHAPTTGAPRTAGVVS
ncbi:long-chain-fatty-acid--CoA ligase [Salinispora arenicola]|uniref:Acyl-CoA synthetase n=1 Tax=Salinispora arenicola TaxID=168697 RepID=A0A542XQR4_SALAC|nr:long-chain-fatty-acid--CoA ligase [Salinispora arenicola]NIL42961.1 long-chain-fatty-acid--CoA ligase [Salinispora arenicola]TQL38132.1 fatty-acyl-CoA synthase [Salinispora arenicola]GIM86603.1 acyl-CoA synthetase [Salinispora arenicola]